MSTVALIPHQARYDLRVFLRDPRARWLTLAMPVLLLLLFGFIFKHQSFSYPGYSIAGDAYYVPRMIVLGIAGATLSSLVITLVAERETGALKRRRATPVPATALVSGDLVTAELSALTIAVVVVAIGWLAFSVHLTATGAGVVILATVLGAAALAGAAFAASTFVTSLESAGPTVMVIMFALNAVSGIYFPDSLLPGWLRNVAEALPMRPLAVTMQAAFDPRTNGGKQFAWPNLLIVAAWGVAGTVYAALRFSWSPKQA